MRAREPDRQRGFTLVEVLAVLAILGLLMSISVMAFRGHSERKRVAATRATMASLEMLITKYNSFQGDYPPDRLDALKIKKSNVLNEGIEACLAALHHKDYRQSSAMTESSLGNTDDDETPTPFHRHGSTQLVEALDGWDNPIAYFHSTSYQSPQEYQLAPEAEESLLDQVVEAATSEVTGVYANADSYQLISAGPDQVFGTDDDVTNFER